MGRGAKLRSTGSLMWSAAKGASSDWWGFRQSFSRTPRAGKLNLLMEQSVDFLVRLMALGANEGRL